MLGDTPASVIVGVAERAGPIFRLPSFYVAIDKSSITFRVAASARPMLVRARSCWQNISARERVVTPGGNSSKKTRTDAFDCAFMMHLAD
jgi:hypothetical protein